MSWPFWIAILVMLVGALGTLLPIIPGTPLIFLAALGYGYYEGFNQITPFLLVVLFLLMALTFLIDYIAGVIGAKKYGATRYGTWGSLIGGVLGVIIFNIPGLIIGPFIGALAGELINGTDFNNALKVGFGTVVGMAGGALVKIILAVAMILVFVNGAV